MNRTISDFFKNELTDYSVYSTIRMLGSACDGLKNAQRKVIYTALEKLKSESKVSQFSGIVSINTEYLHGETSLQSVIQNMAADYCGSNNIPLLKGEGNFGSRFINDPSAPRYVFVENQPFINDIFDIRDVLVEQNFEGFKIEPRFYVPAIPLLAVNGSPSAIASGFKQHILPRKLSEIIKYFETGKADLTPYFKGFKGTIEQGESPNQWLIKGKFHREGKRVIIDEIPIWIEYKKYLDILDSLVESKKIKDYIDKSDSKTDSYCFEIYGISQLNDSKIFDLLKLVKKESETYNALDASNKVVTYDNINQILDYYKEIRLKYMKLQNDFDLDSLKAKLGILSSKYRFVTMIINDKLKINKRSKADIKADLAKTDLVVNDDYEYLLRMPIHSFTKETLEALKKDIDFVESEIKRLENIDLESNWLKTIKTKFKGF